MRSLNTNNCEFFLRPHIAISEFAETIIENVDYLKRNASILDMTSLNAFITKTKRIDKYLRILDSIKEETGMLHFI